MIGIRKNKLWVGPVFLAAWMLLPGSAAGWSAVGHRVVANIAYDRLDPAVRSKIVKILRGHEDFALRFAAKMPDDIRNANPQDQERWIFLQASIWSDLIRSVPKYNKGTWHYMDIPFYLSPHDKDVLQDVIKPNVSFAIPDPLTSAARDSLNCVQAFKLSVRELADADTTDAEKAISYCWLFHLAGDMHQPLHSTALVTRGRFNTADGDRGGNGIKIMQGRNLHGFWDGLIGGDQGLNDIRKRSAEILSSEDLKSAGEKAAGKLAPEVWIQESHELAKSFVYYKVILDEVAASDANAGQPLQKVDLPLQYRQDAGHWAQQRVAQAGYRLAEILKQTKD